MKPPDFTREEENEMEELLAAQRYRTLSQEETIVLVGIQRRYDIFIAEGLDRLRRIAPRTSSSPAPQDTGRMRTILLRGIRRRKHIFWLSISLCFTLVLLWHDLPPMSLPQPTGSVGSGSTHAFADLASAGALLLHVHFQCYLVLSLCAAGVMCRADRERERNLLLVATLALSSTLLFASVFLHLRSSGSGSGDSVTTINATLPADEKGNVTARHPQRTPVPLPLMLIDLFLANQSGILLFMLRQHQ